MVKVKEDLTGKVFGRLTVIKQDEDYIDKKNRHYAQWLCQCSCEEHNTIVVRGSTLKHGSVRSCGCLYKETRSIRENLIGQQFNRLTVIAQAEDYINPKTKKHTPRWICQCSCLKQTITYATSGQLKNGQKKSCGCLRIESNIKNNKKYNEFKLLEDYGLCYLSNGEKVLFDKDDYELLKDYYWSIDSKGYVYTKIDNKYISMHRLIMGVIDDNSIEIDHIKHNKLDNRKHQLRIVTKSQNMQNQSLSVANTSGVTGVSWYQQTGQWRAYIYINKKFNSLGLFNKFEDAVKARKSAEQKYYGEFSYDNSMNICLI